MWDEEYAEMVELCIKEIEQQREACAAGLAGHVENGHDGLLVVDESCWRCQEFMAYLRYSEGTIARLKAMQQRGPQHART